MTTKQIILSYIVVAVVSLIAGVFVANLIKTPVEQPADIIPTHRIDFTLQDMDGQQVSLSQWDGKVIILNFWATWCPPCRKEVPAFIELRDQLTTQNFEIIGVAIDREEAVQDFIDEMGIEYPVLLMEVDGFALMQGYGNQLMTLPYTIIINQAGEIVGAYRREVTKEEILAVVRPLLQAN